MKKPEDKTKEELLEDYKELSKMFIETMNKLTDVSLALVDTTKDKCKLLIEIEEIKEKLNDYEKK